MSPLVITAFGSRLELKSERIEVYERDKLLHEVALRDVREIIIGKKGVSISSDLLAACAEVGIAVAFLDYSGKPYGLFHTPCAHRTVSIRRAQFAFRESAAAGALMRRIVVNKIANQIRLLRYFARSANDTAAGALRAAAQDIRSYIGQARRIKRPELTDLRDSLMGCEGAAAAAYWRALSGWLEIDSFTHRTGRGAEDPVNAALNYGYGILYARIWGAQILAGLEPFAGLLHADRSGKYALVLDAIEEFRVPLVDRPILAHCSRGLTLKIEAGLLDADSRRVVANWVLEAMERRVQYQGREEAMSAVVGTQAQKLAAHVSGRESYRPYRFTH